MNDTIKKKPTQGFFETRPETDAVRASDINATKNTSPRFSAGRISGEQIRILLEENSLFKAAGKAKELIVKEGNKGRPRKEL